MKVDKDLKIKWTKFHGNYPGGDGAAAGRSKSDWAYTYIECWGGS